MLKDKDFGHGPVQVLCQARHNLGAKTVWLQIGIQTGKTAGF
jgi:hypothetical protein